VCPEFSQDVSFWEGDIFFKKIRDENPGWKAEEEYEKYCKLNHYIC
jgi:hypothetical protein